jgi:lipopolysaccharide/colanic/teichoic acid biosynthesis glycosyltransferase
MSIALTPIQLALKRALDLAGSAAALVLLAPFLGGLALAIKLDSPGPALYRQQRIGKDGLPFTLYKFRTMAAGSDETGYLRYLQELIASERAGPGRGRPYRKPGQDARVTRLGRFLRRYYLDELAQLINILRGEMSLVGPRPHVRLEVDQYIPHQRQRLAVRPGLTGLWQVHGKGSCTFNELIQCDLDYIANWSLWLDLKILCATLRVLLHGGEEVWVNQARQIPRRRPAGFTQTPPTPLPGALEAHPQPAPPWFVNQVERFKLQK